MKWVFSYGSIWTIGIRWKHFILLRPLPICHSKWVEIFIFIQMKRFANIPMILRLFAAPVFGCVCRNGVLFNITAHGFLPACNVRIDLCAYIVGRTKFGFAHRCWFIGGKWCFYWARCKHTDSIIQRFFRNIRHNSRLLEMAHLC